MEVNSYTTVVNYNCSLFAKQVTKITHIYSLGVQTSRAIQGSGSNQLVILPL